jgi:hypothetical protein
MKKIIIVCLLSFILSIVGVSAQEGLPDPGITPDSFLYGLDRALEALQKALTLAPEAKAKLALRLASERIAEAEKMERKGKPELASKAAEDYGEELNDAMKHGRKISELAKKKEFETLVANATSVHIDVLERVLEKVPEQAKSAIRKAIDNSKKGREESLDALGKVEPEKAAKLRLEFAKKRLLKVKEKAEEGDTEEAQELAEEYEEELNKSVEMIKRAEALGRNITALAEHVSEMTYKHIEVLQEVLERVPEQAKPHIEHAINVSMKGHEAAVERILERINRTMEGVENFTCGADSDCRGLICPMVIGYDTPVCFGGKCKCGAKWDLNKTEWRERFGKTLTSEKEETLEKVKETYSDTKIGEKMKHVPAGVRH